MSAEELLYGCRPKVAGPMSETGLSSRELTEEWQRMAKEMDPHGIGQHEAGAKLDAGKPNLDLVLGEFSRALVQVGEVGTFGAKKYTPRGWLSVPSAIERYSSAMLRHYFAHRRGEKLDPDTGLPHLAHAAWNALAVLELVQRFEELTQEQEKRING